MRLTKGFEVEVFTGTPGGDVVGLARAIAHSLAGFVCEPDHRSIEYVTPPLREYADLRMALLEPRWRLRQYLHTQGDYTLLPGSTLALEGSDRFERADPSNPYHAYIEQTYGAKVVTTGIHLNLGIADPEALLRVWRVMRLDAQLIHWQTGKALSARTWVWNLYSACQNAARAGNMGAYLQPLLMILDQGNQAQRWLADYRQGRSPRDIVAAATQAFALQDLAEWCSPVTR